MKKKAKRRAVPVSKARLLNAIEQPLRAHSAQMQGIAHRNERLNALKTAATKNELQRVEQLLHQTRGSPHAAVVQTASKLNNELRALASKQ